VLTEVWGYRVARMVIWTGFLANVVVVLFIAAAIAIPADPHYTDQAAYARILGSTPRLVAASLVAYLLGEFLNAFVLARLKVEYAESADEVERYAPAVISVAPQTMDAFLDALHAEHGTFDDLAATLGVTDAVGALRATLLVAP